MAAAPPKLHVVFFPFMASGHCIPMLDIVRLFAAHDNVKSTVITTPLNAPKILKSFENSNTGASSTIDVHIIPFPSQEGSLVEGIENLDQATSLEAHIEFIVLTQLLKDPVECFLEETRPDCLVAGFLFPFATDLAAKLGIPRLVFQGTGFFPKCVQTVFRQYEPHKSVLSDDEPFIIPELPDKVILTKSQFRLPGENANDVDRLFFASAQAAMKSYGEIFNSFYELERDYVDYAKNVLKMKSWTIGPVSLSNRRMAEKLNQETIVSGSKHQCLEWLDSQEPDSVIYICFGSTTKFTGPQLNEIAMGLESSGLRFIWVVSNGRGEEKWSSDGFEKRIQNKGMIVRGWVPQVSILEHEAVGGFVTHCGWNSILEGVSAGVPMVTWPIFAEQFINEKLITDILRIGVQVGSKQWNFMSVGTFLKAEAIAVALKRITVGDEALEMRIRSKKIKDLATEAVDEGGSSDSDLSSLINELRSLAK